MKTLTILIALTFTVIFSSTSFAGEKYICEEWTHGDKSKSGGKFGLNIERERITIIKNVGKSFEQKVQYKFTKKFKYAPISLYTNERETRHVTLIRKEKSKNVELHAWKINAFSESGRWTKEYSVDHWSGLSYSKCYSF